MKKPVLEDILIWSYENGCPYDERVCYRAAEGGHLHVLEWADDNGFPWDEGICEGAWYNEHEHVLEWVRNWTP